APLVGIGYSRGGRLVMDWAARAGGTAFAPRVQLAGRAVGVLEPRRRIDCDRRAEVALRHIVDTKACQLASYVAFRGDKDDDEDGDTLGSGAEDRGADASAARRRQAVRVDRRTARDRAWGPARAVRILDGRQRQAR